MPVEHSPSNLKAVSGSIDSALPAERGVLDLKPMEDGSLDRGVVSKRKDEGFPITSELCEAGYREQVRSPCEFTGFQGQDLVERPRLGVNWRNSPVAVAANISANLRIDGDRAADAVGRSAHAVTLDDIREFRGGAGPAPKRADSLRSSFSGGSCSSVRSRIAVEAAAELQLKREFTQENDKLHSLHEQLRNEKRRLQERQSQRRLEILAASDSCFDAGPSDLVGGLGYPHRVDVPDYVVERRSSAAVSVMEAVGNIGTGQAPRADGSGGGVLGSGGGVLGSGGGVLGSGGGVVGSGGGVIGGGGGVIGGGGGVANVRGDGGAELRELTGLTMLAQMMAEFQRENRLPRREPSKFTGANLEEYVPFVMEFDSMIVNSCDDASLLYSYLVNYTAGEAGDIVRSCFSTNRGEAYRLAREALEKRYGDSFMLAHQFLCRLKEWPAIKKDQPEELRRFSVFLNRVGNMSRRSNHFDVLSSGHELRAIVDKLPYHLVTSWGRRAYKIKRNGGFVDFAALVRFVQEESDIIQQPYFGGLFPRAGYGMSSANNSKRVLATTMNSGKLVSGSVCTYEDWQQKPGKSVEQHNSSPLTGANREAISSRIEPMITEVAGRRCWGCDKIGHDLDSCRDLVTLNDTERARYLDGKGLCVFCRGRHLVSGCSLFRKREISGRRDFVRKSGLCFVCLRFGHWTKECRNGAIRSALLTKASNNPGKRSNSSVESHMSHVVVARREGKMSPTVVADVQAANGTWIRTRVAMDAHSSVSFIDSRLAGRLNLSGKVCRFTLTTFSESAELRKSQSIRGVRLRAMDGSCFRVASMYSIDRWPFCRNDVPPSTLIKHNEVLAHRIDDSEEYPIEILIGMDEPRLVRSLESVDALEDGTLYASRYPLGWAVCGRIVHGGTADEWCRRVDLTLEEEIRMNFSAAFEDGEPLALGESVEDALWRQKVQSTLKRRDDEKIEIGLPFRDDHVHLPYNYGQAMGSMNSLAKRFARDPQFASEYKNYMSELIRDGILEEVPGSEVIGRPGSVFFLCHHAVFHKTKNKIRIVFDCSRKYQGVCLNDVLIRGPDLMNRLVGVLLRFRAEAVAVVGDIRKMFLQLKVPVDHSNFMRILWWPGGDSSAEPRQYRLTTHTFGAVSSPSIANYAVKWAAQEQEFAVSSDAITAVRSSIYVDDLLCGFPDDETASRTLQEVRNVLRYAGFDLVNIASTSRDVMAKIAPEDMNEEFRGVDFQHDDLPTGRVLGVFWDIQRDCFSFHISKPSGDWTRRRMLSAIASLFDPLGLVLPFVVSARSLFQETCRQHLGWDEDVPNDILNSWLEWLHVLPSLVQCSFPRNICLTNKGNDRLELHIFCDGSLTAYAAVAYVRRIANAKVVGVHLVQSRARQTPIGRGPLRTVPRIELNAARLAVELAVSLRMDCAVNWDEEYFWTDSSIVLSYLRSITGRFQRFVANRVSFIQSNTQVSAWRFVPGKSNVADIASRGTCDVSVLTSEEWRCGPSFLSKIVLPVFDSPGAAVGNLEVCRQVHVYDLSTSGEFWFELFANVSCWLRMRRRVAIWFSFIDWLRTRKAEVRPMCSDIVRKAEVAIWRGAQLQHFGDQIDRVRRGLPVQKGNRLEPLCPYIDEDGLLKSDGRLGKLDQSIRPRPVIILPGKSVIIVSLVTYLHEREGHLGGSHLQATVNEAYWVFGLTCLVRSVVRRCVRCRRAQARPLCPRMADLPRARVEPVSRPFTFCGIDIFGPFHLKERRSLLKRYGVIFSCLTTRAVHFEVVSSLSADSFINGFRRFEARRGKPVEVFCDNGTNLVGAKRELEEGLKELRGAKVQFEMSENAVKWNFRPPAASHWGGAWEREIRTARKVLWSLFQDRPCRLTDELLSTLMCEVERILNRRPLTPVQAMSPDMGPLTPAHLLMPGVDEAGAPCLALHEDVHYPKRWRAVQRYADEFWTRWRKEYLVLIQQRVKWTKGTQNFNVGDLVLLMDSCLPRFRWPLGVVSEVKPSDDGVVRQVVIRVAPPRNEVGTPAGGRVVELIRPVTKLVPVLRVTDA